MRKGIEKKYLILHGWENREQNIWGIYKWELSINICFGDGTSGTFPIIASVSRTKITRSHGLITLWMQLFSTVLLTSSPVLTYRKSKLCKKRRINIWICRSPYLQCRPSWVTAHTQFYQVTFMAPKYHSLDAPWSLGRKSVFCTFLCVLYRVRNARSAFYTWVRIL